MLVDFAFTPERGLYACSMNKSGMKKLECFLKLYITEEKSLQYWYARVYHWGRQNPLKAGVVAVISVFGFWWILFPAALLYCVSVIFGD